MDQPDEQATDLPVARVRRNRLFRIAWIVPVIAAAVAGWLVWERMRAYGPEITIQFDQGAGLRIGQTPVKYRGVPIGEVTNVELSEDHKHVLVKARLRRTAASVANEGAIFWIVRPQ
ncbi:MAG TPA: MlaD family protein, partial [Burkholderiales bacterium]|nr:MlaD family protein [Burkholderiales bacterium]